MTTATPIATTASSAHRSRMMLHPGPFNPVRIQSRHAASCRHVRLTLVSGLSLFDAIVKPLIEIGIKSASFTILGGYFDQIEYCVAAPDPSHQAMIAYSKPIQAGPAYMIFGNATMGKNQHGKPIVHCHAAIRTQDGIVKGGHIITDTCIVGSIPISVLVTSLDGFELRVTYDPETNIPLLQPQAESPNE